MLAAEITNWQGRQSDQRPGEHLIITHTNRKKNNQVCFILNVKKNTIELNTDTLVLRSSIRFWIREKEI